MKRSLLAPVFAMVLCMACSKNTKDTATPGGGTNPPPVTEDSIPEAKYNITLLDASQAFVATPVVNNMVRQDYNELSGIAASKVNAGVLYVHDDANGTNEIPLTNAKGEDLGKLVLDGISPRNPEDIKVAPGPDANTSYIYLADIGDNANGRTNVAIYRFAEPSIATPDASTAVHISTIDKITLVYPSGAVNAETLLVDPLTKDLFIASKQTGKSILYKAAYPQSTTATITLKAVLKTSFDLFTSGDVSPDGKEILLRNKSQIFYWPRTAAQSLADAMLLAPQTVPYAGNEHQGEGICFAADAGGYYTDTEIRDYPGAVSTLSFYKRK